MDKPPSELEKRGIELHIVVLGEEKSGKTSIVNQYSYGTFIKSNPESSSEEIFIKHSEQGNRKFKCHICVTAGIEEYRSQPSLNDVDAFVLVFSLISRNSLNNIESKWFPIMTQYSKSKKLPFVLVGNKLDLRDSKKCTCQSEPCENENHFIQEKEGRQLAERLNAIAYVEVSATNGRGLGITFGYIMDVILKKINISCRTCAATLLEGNRNECFNCQFMFCNNCFHKSKEGLPMCKRCLFTEQTAKLLEPLKEEEVQLRENIPDSPQSPRSKQRRRSISMDFINEVSDWLPKLPRRSVTPSPWKSSTSLTTLQKPNNAHKANTISTSKSPRRPENPFASTPSSAAPSTRRRVSTNPSKVDHKKMVKLLEDKIQTLLQEKSKAMASGEEDRATFILEEVCRLQDQLTHTINS